jgi:hypothetical protein
VGGGTAARRGTRMCSAKDSRGAHVRKRVRCLKNWFANYHPFDGEWQGACWDIQDLDGASALSSASIGSAINSLTNGVWMSVGECHLSSHICQANGGN